jgi:hypothetical protein
MKEWSSVRHDIGPSVQDEAGQSPPKSGAIILRSPARLKQAKTSYRPDDVRTLASSFSATAAKSSSADQRSARPRAVAAQQGIRVGSAASPSRSGGTAGTDRPAGPGRVPALPRSARTRAFSESHFEGRPGSGHPRRTWWLNPEYRCKQRNSWCFRIAISLDERWETATLNNDRCGPGIARWRSPSGGVGSTASCLPR